MKFLPPAIPIPEGYTWVVIHGGWTLIPKVNSDKFVTPDQPPITPTVSDPLDEELVDWDDDEDDQEFLADDFADVNDIPEECDDFADPAIIASVVQHSEVRRSDRNKKPSTRWNEEAGFIQHPPRSSKKKIPEDPREAKDSTQQVSSDSIQSVKRSLDFLSTRTADLASGSTQLHRSE